MYEKERQELLDLKKQMEYVPVPNEKVSAAIQSGFSKAKHKKRKRLIKYTGLAAAAIVLLFCISLVRVSPSFANALSSIPGAEKIINLIRNDKGYMSAVENDFLQSVGQTQEKDGYKVTIESLIVDRHRMVVFYHIEGAGDEIQIEFPDLLIDGDGVEQSISYSAHENGFGSLDFNLVHQLEDREEIELKVHLKNDTSLIGPFKFPLKIDHSLYKGQHKQMAIDETVTIDNQRITFGKVEIDPLSVRVDVKYDPNNTKKIFHLNHVRLMDDKGEIWGSTGSHFNEEESEIYIESNYFRKPEKLYLLFDGIHALDKDELIIEVDEKTGRLLKYPSDGLVKSSKIEENKVYIFMKIPKSKDTVSGGGMITDGTGKEISTGEAEYWEIDGLDAISFYYKPEEIIKGPLNIELDTYPLTHKKQVKLQIK